MAKRNCGRDVNPEASRGRLCPVNSTTGESQRWLELFGYCLRFGFQNWNDLSARDAEAMALLWEEWNSEIEHARRRTEHGE
jgi:hypothetical protein